MYYKHPIKENCPGGTTSLMMMIIFKNPGYIKGERNTWHRPDANEMKCINKR